VKHASRAALLAAAFLIPPAAARADDLSGADKLRVIYSNQFNWTDDGLPIVTVRIAEGRDRVVLHGANLRVQPDGEGGSEIKSGETWTVRLEHGKAAVVRYRVAAGSWPMSDKAAIDAEMERWRARGETAHVTERGTLFAVHGEVLDQRRLLITLGEPLEQAAAKRRADELAKKYGIEPLIEPEIAELPSGTVEASDERGVSVRNNAILWFAAPGFVTVDDVDKEAGGREPRRYFGRIYVTVDRSGKLAVVNAVPEDKLLAGLVPAEMLPSAPPEALKAQAIAARNELLAKLGTRHLTDPYRLCSTQHCQVYAGAGHEDARATAAVAATRGVLLERKNGGLVDAVYSASCGGHTEDNEGVWGGAADPALRGVLDGDEAYVSHRARFAKIGASDEEVRAFLATADDGGPQPYCAKNRPGEATRRWTARIDLAALGKRAGVGTVKKLEVLARGVGGRVSKLRVTGERGQAEAHGELDVRRMLGSLKSALFVLDEQHDAGGALTGVAATGLGHGHGIGMCQIGAMGMAERGKNAEQILQHYYRGARLRKLY
jgi:SpoIID/LytB domain protein